MTAIPNSVSSHALILAPQGRDASVAAALLADARIAESKICGDLAAFHAALGDNVCFAIVTEEATVNADLRPIASFIGAQAAWSDLPFIVLTHRGGGPERRPAAARLAEILGNVTFVERPFHPITFVSVGRTALKGRLRQYEARARMLELREGEERLRTALLAGHLGSWELDLTSGTLTASDTFKALFARQPGEPMTYEQLLAGVHHDDRGRVRDAVRRSIETGVDYEIEYRHVWPDGAVHWVELRARLVHHRAGEPKLVGVALDFTERKMAEDNLRRLNETLEARVAERTAELEHAHATVLEEIAQRHRTEDLLRQAQKMEMIGQLTGGVAHDFNNLLMAVLGNLDLLRKHIAADPRASRLIEGALQGARRGAALTQRLLAFARRQELKIEPRNVIQLVRGMTDLLERSVGQQIDLVIELPASLPPALVDANQVELALLNLVVNARDAMPDGGVLTIALDVVHGAADGDIAPGAYVRLTVSDTGFGMDAQTLMRATEPFFSTKDRGKGTGLGLSMIQGLAEQLRGALRLSSEPGRGTRAELWLPVGEGAERPADATNQAGMEIEKMAILFVDDDALIAMSTVDLLEDLGHDVVAANSAARAMEILRGDQPIDLLITDFSMPKMNGAQLAVAARALRPELPILMATGYAELPDGSGIDLPRLAKPYDQKQLAAGIAKVLQGVRK